MNRYTGVRDACRVISLFHAKPSRAAIIGAAVRASFMSCRDMKKG